MPDRYLISPRPSWILLCAHLQPDLLPHFTFSSSPTSVYSDVRLSLNNIWYCFVCACLIDNGSHYLSYFSVLPVMFNMITAADDSTSPRWLCLGSWPRPPLPAGTQVIAQEPLLQTHTLPHQGVQACVWSPPGEGCRSAVRKIPPSAALGSHFSTFSSALDT